MSGVYSDMSAGFDAIIDTTAPTVVLDVFPTQTFDTQPPATVTATDALAGFPSPATVTLDVDLNDDGDFSDTVGGHSETGYATGTLVNGSVVFDSYPALTPGSVVRFQARVDDLAGNEGTSPSVTVTILAPIMLPPDLRSTYGGMAGWTTPADALAFAGNVTTAAGVDVDDSPESVRGADAAFVYNSQEANPVKVVQAVIPSDNTLGVPTAVTGTLTWDGSTGATITYDLSNVSAGADWVFGAAAPTGLSTGAHTFALNLFLDYPGTANDTPLEAIG